MPRMQILSPAEQRAFDTLSLMNAALLDPHTL
jgi:hypothetical protein